MFYVVYQQLASPLFDKCTTLVSAFRRQNENNLQNPQEHRLQVPDACKLKIVQFQNIAWKALQPLLVMLYLKS